MRFEASAKRELYRSCWSVLRGGGLRPSLALRQAAEPKWGSVRHRLCSPCPGRAKRLAASAAPSSSWAVRPLAASAPTEVVQRVLCSQRVVSETVEPRQRKYK